MFFIRLIISLFCNVVIFGSLLFLPACTWYWWRAWTLLGLVFILTIITMITVFRENKPMINPKMKSVMQAGAPAEHKVILLFFVLSCIGLVIFIPLDVFHWHLRPRPGVSMNVFGLILFIVGWWVISLAFKANPFSEESISYLDEYRPTVIQRGIYRVVRHPIYMGVIFMLLGMPLWLNSYASVLVALIPIAVLVVRTYAEESYLKTHLAGYDDYTTRVRYKLFPLVW